MVVLVQRGLHNLRESISQISLLRTNLFRNGIDDEDDLDNDEQASKQAGKNPQKWNCPL